ncbi:MAG: TRAP transporter substrate-binding protein DctP [Desulfobacter sp.]|nr:MAG: TRAP transporter substrate-binding protein DctP [Desulfobacter sp.]
MPRVSRRTFLRYSFGALSSMVYFTIFPRQPWEDRRAFAETLKEEKRKKRLAKYIFNFSSPYFTSNYLTTPHAHLEIKRLIEKYTKNKIFVIIHDGGSRGIGSELSNWVSLGKSEGALLSIANLSPLCPELDILNIPFWAANETEYIRLFNSQAWNRAVLSKTRKARIQVLFPYVVGERTATSTKRYGKLIKSPKDFEGVRFRVPGSESLALFYRLTKAKPMNIPWKFCARTARGGRYDALDPAIIGLYAGPEGLNRELGIISEIKSVHDGWVAIANTDYIAALDSRTRSQFLDAFNEIQGAQLKNYKTAVTFCSEEFKKLGVKIYAPTPREQKVLAKKFGPANPAWEPVKKRLLGADGLAVFDKFYKIAKG